MVFRAIAALLARRQPVGLCGLLVIPGLICTAASAQTAAPDALSETYRDWAVACFGQPEGGARACEMTQRLSQRDGGQQVLLVSARRDAIDGAALTIVTPFGVRLADGVALAAAGRDEPLLIMPYITCLANGCIAEGAIDGATVGTLQEATTLEAVLVSVAGETLRLAVSMDGFAAAWARLEVLR
jgi:invasion protein IalB